MNLTLAYGKVFDELTISKHDDKENKGQGPVKKDAERHQGDEDIDEGGNDIEQNELERMMNAREKSLLVIPTSKLRLMAAPRSKTRNISPVFRRVCHAKERLSK